MARSRVQVIRSNVAGARPSGREPGELYTSWADRQIGVVDAARQPMDLVGVRYFAATAAYAAGDLIGYAGAVLRAVHAVVPGPFVPADWTVAGGAWVSDMPPSPATPGQTWWDSVSGNSYVWFVDASGTAQWVQFNMAAHGSPTPAVPMDFPAAPLEGQVYVAPGGPHYRWQDPVWSVVADSVTASSDDMHWPTRAALVASVAGGMPLFAGKVYTAGGYDYIGSPGAAALPGLPGLLEHGDLSPEHFGVPQGSDQTTLLQTFISYAAVNGRTILWPDGGDYRFQSLVLDAADLVVDWRTSGTGCTLTSLKTSPAPVWGDDYAIYLRGTGSVSSALTANAQLGQDYADVADASSWAVGDLCEIRSTRMIQTENRGIAREGQTCKVKSISANRLYLADPLHYYAPANDTFTGAVVAVASTTQMTLAASIDRQPRDMMSLIRMTSGAQNGVERYITGWNNTTKVATFTVAWPGSIAPGDTYVFEWKSSAVCIEPIKINIGRGMRFTRAPHTGAVAEDLGFAGLRILFADAPSLEGIKVENFSEAGIYLTSCVRPRVVECEVNGCNRMYNAFDGTGYGIGVVQCYRPHIADNYGQGNRRLIDFGGAQAINWYGKSIRNTAVGGGKTYSGADMFPADPLMNTQVSGSHGGAHGTVYDGDTGIHVYGVHNLRGLNERIVSGFGYGYMQRPILLHAGGGHVIENFHYSDMFSEIGKDAATRYAIAGTPGLRASGLVEIRCDTLSDQADNLPTRVFNCTGMKFTSFAIYLNGGTATDGMANLEFGNIRVNASTDGIATTPFQFIRSSVARDIRNFTDLGGNAYSFDGVEYTSFLLAEYAGDLVLPVNTWVKLAGGRYSAHIADDAAIAIPVGNASGMARISIYDQQRDRIYRAVDILAGVNSATDYSPLVASNKVNVELSLAVLAGTTGTDGKVTLAYRAANDSYLRVENRSGNVARPIISVEYLP